MNEAIEITAVHSVAGTLPGGAGLVRTRPFRAPHPTVSDVGLIGGGDGARAHPGEVSLAHHGVLFLDEFAEFRRAALEALRQPLEDGVVTISRARAKATFFARPMLVAAMNPCPCGYLGDGTDRCACRAARIRAYRSRLSGPILDRIDVHVALPPVNVSALQSGRPGEASEPVRKRVQDARDRQRERQRQGLVGSACNAALSPSDLARAAPLSSRSETLLATSVSALGLSARAYGKVIRVARTLADLEGASDVAPAHVGEAIGFRTMDR